MATNTSKAAEAAEAAATAGRRQRHRPVHAAIYGIGCVMVFKASGALLRMLPLPETYLATLHA